MGQQRDKDGEDVVVGGNAEPLEEVGPEECAPKAQECEYKAGSLDENPDASTPKFSEEVLEAFHPEPDLMIPSPIDGLPMAADEGQPRQGAPAFTYENVVCLEDDREWVEMFQEEQSTPIGLYRSRFSSIGDEKEPLRFSPKRVMKRQGFDVVELTQIEARAIGTWWARQWKNFVRVQPRRPRCQYYKRQVFSNDSETDPTAFGHKIVFRNCTERRSVGGAFMSLRDEAIFACDYRSPPDPRSVAQFIDDLDTKRLRGDAHRHHLPIFGKKE